MDLQITIGQVLRRVRGLRGMTLVEVASSAGTTASHLSYIERGVKSPGSEMLYCICRALGVPMSTIILEASFLLEAAERRAEHVAA